MEEKRRTTVDPGANGRVRLGATELEISPMGLGAWAWGDSLLWEYGRTHAEPDIRAAYEVTLSSGINLIDTAEAYAQGQSERLVGKFIREGGNPVVATKFFPYPWRLTPGSLTRALKGSIARLGLSRVDLYQLHWPFPPVSIETWMAAMADAVAAGLAKAVGVSNYSLRQTQRAYHALARQGVVLASNQVDYSLLDRRAERSGLLRACKELGVTVIAYSPLDQGLLTGKYSPVSPPSGVRGRTVSHRRLAEAQTLISRMREIGERHGGKTPAQIALNWVMCKGAVPIPGVKNLDQAQANLGALGWRLAESELAALDAASDKYDNMTLRVS